MRRATHFRSKKENKNSFSKKSLTQPPKVVKEKFSCYICNRLRMQGQKKSLATVTDNQASVDTPEATSSTALNADILPPKSQNGQQKVSIDFIF